MVMAEPMLLDYVLGSLASRAPPALLRCLFLQTLVLDIRYQYPMHQVPYRTIQCNDRTSQQRVNVSAKACTLRVCRPLKQSSPV